MFILSRDRPANSHEEWQAGWNRYVAYLESLRGSLPAEAYAFATAPWHYDFSDSRAPHDAWLERFVVEEFGDGERHENRSTRVSVVMLGAYHDGCIELTYDDVSGMEMTAAGLGRGYGDWRYDEVRRSADGHVEHEVEWSGGGRWLITCGNIRYRWIADAEQCVPPEPAQRSSSDPDKAVAPAR